MVEMVISWLRVVGGGVTVSEFPHGSFLSFVLLFGTDFGSITAYFTSQDLFLLFMNDSTDILSTCGRCISVSS